MAPPKRIFPCGHRGRGQFCHRCHQIRQEYEQREIVERASRQEREFVEREWGVQTEGLLNYIVHKAAKALRAIGEGNHLALFDTKRMEFDRNCIAADLSRDYRLLLKQHGDGRVRPVKIVTHAEYNTLIHNSALKGW